MVAADTAVLYMAAHDAEAVRDELLRQGMRPDTPVVTVESVSLPGERSKSFLLKELTALKAEGPVLLLFGEVFAQEVVRSARTASQAA